MDPSKSLREWCVTNRENLSRLGVTCNLTETPDRAPPSAAWIDLETPEREVRAILFPERLCDVEIVDYIIGTHVLIEHHVVENNQALNRLLGKTISEMMRSDFDVNLNTSLLNDWFRTSHNRMSELGIQSAIVTDENIHEWFGETPDEPDRTKFRLNLATEWRSGLVVLASAGRCYMEVTDSELKHLSYHSGYSLIRSYEHLSEKMLWFIEYLLEGRPQ